MEILKNQSFTHLLMLGIQKTNKPNLDTTVTGLLCGIFVLETQRVWVGQISEL